MQLYRQGPILRFFGQIPLLHSPPPHKSSFFNLIQRPYELGENIFADILYVQEVVTLQKKKKSNIFASEN